MLALAAALLPALPVAYLVVRAGGAGSEAWSRALEADLVGVAARSMALALLVGAGTVTVAVPYAFLVVRSDLPARRLWALAGALPLVVPSYVGAVALVGAFGPRGMVQALLAPVGVERLPAIYGFWGAWATLVLFTYPYALLLVAAAWRRTDRTLERAARGMGRGGWTTFARVVLPQLRPSIVAGALLAALYALGDFGVVSIMRVDTFTRQIYLRYGALFDREGAAVLGLVLCALTLLVLVAERRVLRGDQRAARRRLSAVDDDARVRLGAWRIPALAFVATVAALSLVVPAAVLGWWVTQLGLDGAWANRLGDTATAAASSLLAASLGAVAATLLALPIALLAVRSPGRLTSVAEGLAYVGYALPGIVAALGLVFFATRGAFWLYQTLALLVLAYVIRFLPQALSAVRASLERIDPRLEDAARGLGAGPLSVVRRVTLPLAAPGVAAGAMLVLLTALKELPATLVLRPTGMETLATTIWRHTSVSDYREAAVPALVLVAVSAVPLWVLVIRPGAEPARRTARSGSPPSDGGAGD